MINFNKLITSTICTCVLVTSVFAANPASTEYVDKKVQVLQTQINDLQTQINNIKPGITYTAGTGISITGTTISATTTSGIAEFIRTIQVPNDSVPPGTAFTIDTQVFNSVPTAVVASLGDGGTVFTLTTGTYTLDYEMSLESAGSIGLYTGPNAGALTLDPNTVVGSSTSTTWIHGKALVVVPSTPLVVAVSSVVGTASVSSAGTDVGSFMVRLIITKLT